MYDEYLEKLEEVGKLRNLKPRTIQPYQNSIQSLLTWADKNPETLTCEDAKDFLVFQKFLNCFHFYAFLTTGLGNLPVSIIVSSILANPSGSRI